VRELDEAFDGDLDAFEIEETLGCTIAAGEGALRLTHGADVSVCRATLRACVDLTDRSAAIELVDPDGDLSLQLIVDLGEVAVRLDREGGTLVAAQSTGSRWTPMSSEISLVGFADPLGLRIHHVVGDGELRVEIRPPAASWEPIEGLIPLPVSMSALAGATIAIQSAPAVDPPETLVAVVASLVVAPD
jgi:hypothetical protein